MSFGQLVEKGIDVLFNKFGCTITSSNIGEVIISRRKVIHMFMLSDTKNKCLIANEEMNSSRGIRD